MFVIIAFFCPRSYNSSSLAYLQDLTLEFNPYLGAILGILH